MPRLMKNTAIGSHADPVGSITTSNRVWAVTPASAAASTPARLSTVGRARRRQTAPPRPSSTRTVWSLATPRSIPTRRLSSIIALSLPQPLTGVLRPAATGYAQQVATAPCTAGTDR